MEFNWKHEVWVWAQYTLLALVASSFALVFQAEARADPLAGAEGMAVDYSRAEVLKGAGAFYGWLLLLLAAFGAARLLIVRAWRRTPDRFSRGGRPR